MSKHKEFDFPPEYVIHDLCHAQCDRGGRANQKGELTVICPVNPKKKFQINIANGGIWNCFKGCPNCPAANKKKGILEFYCLYFNCSDTKEAYKQIKESMGQGEQKKKVAKRKSEMMKPIDTIETADPDILDKAYTALLDNLSLTEEHYKDLIKRGLSEQDIEDVKFRSMPQNGLITIAKAVEASGCTIKGVPGFYMEDQNPKLNVFGSGYLIPYRNEKGQIIALQIRKDVTLTDDMSEEQKRDVKSRRYRWLTSSDKNGGSSATNWPFYGIQTKNTTTNVVYATEGGLKAAVAQSLSDGWFVAIPGVSCFTAWRQLLTYLKNKGVTHIVDAFDSDRATNPNVAANIEKLHTIAKEEYGYNLINWDWGTEQKGVDDYLLYNGGDKLLKVNCLPTCRKLPNPDDFKAADFPAPCKAVPI